MTRGGIMWSVSALLGIVSAAAIAWSATLLAGQHIGLASEPLSVSGGLAPAAGARHANLSRHLPALKPPRHAVAPPRSPSPSGAYPGPSATPPSLPAHPVAPPPRPRPGQGAIAVAAPPPAPAPAPVRAGGGGAGSTPSVAQHEDSRGSRRGGDSGSSGVTSNPGGTSGGRDD